MIKPDVEMMSDGAQLVFCAICLSRNEACWRAFILMSTKSVNGTCKMNDLQCRETNTQMDTKQLDILTNSET